MKISTMPLKPNRAAQLRGRLAKCAAAAAAFALVLAIGLPAQAAGDGKIQVINQKNNDSYTSIKGVEVNVFNYNNSANERGLGPYGYKFFHSESYGGAGVDTAVDGIAGSGPYNVPNMSPLLGSDGYPVVVGVDMPYLDASGVAQKVVIDGKETPLLRGLNGQTEVPYVLESDGRKTIYTDNGDGTFTQGETVSANSLAAPVVSMSYLFDTSKNGSGISVTGYHKGTMADGGGLFQKDSEGYYYYDSAQNAAYYNQVDNFFELYNTVIRPWYTTNNKTGGPLLQAEWGNFLPFNQLSDSAVAFDTQGSNDLATNSDGTNNAVFMPSGIGSETPYSARLAENNLVDLWFGMTVDFEFYMPQGGMVDATPNDKTDDETTAMKFDFHGDDDVFLYINGVLVLDIGGTHGAKDGWIDFSTGVVFDPTCAVSSGSSTMDSLSDEQLAEVKESGEFVNSRWEKGEKLDDETVVPDCWVGYPKELVEVTEKTESGYSVTTYTCTYKTLAEIFRAAKGADFNPAHFTDSNGDGNLDTFANYTEHTLKFFYMERGGNISYCRLKYNMPILQGELNVAKRVDENTIEDEDATYDFVLYECGNGEASHGEEEVESIRTCVEGVMYVVLDEFGAMSEPKTLGEDGKFTLKANQIASFLFDTSEGSSGAASGGVLPWTVKHYCVGESSSDEFKATKILTIPIKADENHHNGEISDVPNFTVPFKLAVDETVDAEFENTLIEDLLIEKQVAGGSIPTSSSWDFEVTLSGDILKNIIPSTAGNPNSQFTLACEVRDADGNVVSDSPTTITFIKDGQAEGSYVGAVTIGAGQTAVIKGVPAGAGYNVEETTTGNFTTSVLHERLTSTATDTVANDDQFIKAGWDSKVTFTNTFASDDGESVAGSKALLVNGSEVSLEDYSFDFSFKMTALDGAPAPANDIVSANKADGAFGFNLTYTHEDCGKDYQYLIEEVKGTNPYITYDEARYLVTVSVSYYDVDNRVAAAVTSFKKLAAGDELTGGVEVADRKASFTNSYNPPPPILPSDPSASAAISASKLLDGKAPGSHSFTFQLKDSTGAVVATASNSASGAISFGSLTFDAPGTYKYSISEVAGADEDFEYDASVFGATVTVTEGAGGSLSASVSYDATPVFANKTKYEPVEVTLSAIKTLDGKAPGGKVFDFALQDVASGTYQMGKSDASGNVTFGALTFDTEGTYKYVMSEVATSDERYEYDLAVYEITITVTKGDDGKLVAATTVTKDGAPYSGTPAFANKTVEPDPDPVLPDTGDEPKPEGPIAGTGDGSPILPLAVLLVAAAAGIVLALRMMRRRA